jgi:hypothetical protein
MIVVEDNRGINGFWWKMIDGKIHATELITIDSDYHELLI